MQDFYTVVWKEWREALQVGFRSGRISGPSVYLLTMVVAGLAMSVPTGADFPHSWRAVYVAMVTSAFSVAAIISESIAGERERHTLETLLASRLSDRSIVLGKLAAAVAHGAMNTGVILATGVIATVARFGVDSLSGGISPVLVGALLGPLAGLLIGAAGIFISMRAPTVKSSQQALMVLLMLMALGPLFGARFVDAETMEAVVRRVAGLDPIEAALYGALLLAVLDAALVLAALRRFRRPKLLTGI